MSSARTTSNNSYSVDRSQALAQLQSNYGMTGGLNGYRLPNLEKSSKTADADLLTPSSSSDDGSSFSTSSTANSTTSSKASSLKAKATSLFKFSSSSSHKCCKRQAAALTGLENDSMATLISTTSSSASQKPDPALVFAHMSATYGVSGHGFGGYKIPNLEKESCRCSCKSSSNKKSTRVQPARDSPEAVLAELMNSYGAPGRSQLVQHT